MRPDWVTFNGYANQYKDHPLTADVGDTVRFYVVAAGPSLDTAFHVVGAMLDRVYLDSTTTNVLEGVQTQLVPAGGGMIFDVKFRERRDLPVREPLLRSRRHGRARSRERRQRRRHHEPLIRIARPHRAVFPPAQSLRHSAPSDVRIAEPFGVSARATLFYRRPNAPV